MGVHGVGSHTGWPATNATIAEVDPGVSALSSAVKLSPAAWLESTDTMRGFETFGGPGQEPPVPAIPPRSTMTEPTVAQTGVT